MLSAADSRFRGSEVNAAMASTLLSLRLLLAEEARNWLATLCGKHH